MASGGAAILRALRLHPPGAFVSKQDTHFINMFSAVLGILIGIAILLFALAKIVGNSTQAQHVRIEPKMKSAVDERTRPFARVAVAGQDNAALVIEEEKPGGEAPGLPVPTSGEEMYKAACTACHDQGIGGAPKLGDKSVWAPRIAQGNDVLYKHAIEGYQGKAGLMPPKGGRVDLSDELVRAGVDYMIERSQ